jgi:hypothetical protein
MSLLRAVLRSCAVAALRDKTWAEERCYDSDMTPFVDAVYGVKDSHGNPVNKPYICVYTDNDDIGPVTGKAELYNGMNRMLSVCIEIGVATAIKNPNGTMSVQFAHTDKGSELGCDFIEAQCIAGLIGDPHSVWGDLFKQMCGRIRRVPRRRGGQASAGVRWAARRIVLLCSPIMDIVPGVALEDSHPIRKFITLARANPHSSVGDVAMIVDQAISTVAAPDWRQAQAMLGMDTEAVKHLVVPGVPLPSPEGIVPEQPPLDYSDLNEYPPGMSEIEEADYPLDQ